MLIFLFYTAIFLAFHNVGFCRENLEVLDTCLDAKYHKVKPAQEPQLHGQDTKCQVCESKRFPYIVCPFPRARHQWCSAWRSRACCEANSTLAFHQSDTWINFTWNHCPGHRLSPACRDWFLKDLCFYECSPNVGPWIVEHKIKIRNERFLNAPLCSSQCNSWWEACRNEYTCLSNWEKGFNWTSGLNTCPDGTTCRPFWQIFNNSAPIFCGQIWGSSWTVVPDSQPCLKIGFNGSNPNDAVAKYYAENSSAITEILNVYLLWFFVLVLLI